LLSPWSAEAASSTMTSIQAGVSALPEVLQALGMAQKLGVSNATIAAATDSVKVKEAADLNLLAEVSRLAGSSMGALPAGFKSAIYEEHAEEDAPRRIGVAIGEAKKAGLPDHEIEAAKTAVRSHANATIFSLLGLSGAAGSGVGGLALDDGAVAQKNRRLQATTPSHSAESIQRLALALDLGAQFGVDSDVLKSGVAAYEAQMQGNFGAADVPFVLTAVLHAGHARARPPPEVAGWPRAAQIAKDAASLSGEGAGDYDAWINAIREAQAAGLPEIADITTCKGKAQAVISTKLNASSAQAKHETVQEYLTRFLDDIESAELAGAATSGARSTAKTIAAQELATVLASNLTADVYRINAAFELAARVGVDGIDAQRAELTRQVTNLLSNAAVGVSGTCTPKGMESLAQSMYVGRKLRHNQTELATTAQVYESKIADCLAIADVTCVVHGVEFAGLAGAGVPQQAGAWHRSARSLSDALGLASGHPQELDSLLRVVEEAQAAGLPQNYTDFSSAKTRAQSLALSRAADALSANDTEDALIAMDAAKRAGVSDAQLASTKTQVEAKVSAELSAACAVELSSIGDCVAILMAIDRARRAGVPEATIEAARNGAEARFGQRLAAARMAVENSKTTSEKALETLAGLGDFGRKLKYNASEMALAARAFEAALPQGTVAPSDVPLIEKAVTLRDMLGARLPEQYLTWTVVAQQVREALVASKDESRIGEVTNTIERAQQAALPDIPEFIALKERARAIAAFKLVTAVSGDGAALSSAISVAVQAGVSASNLAGANAVAQAVG